MKTNSLAAIAAVFGLAACAVSDPGAVTRLGASPVLTGGTYSVGGGLTVASELREVGGRTALCGVWSESRAQTPFTKGQARDVIASGTAYLDGQRLVTGLAFMRKVTPGTEYSGLPAKCVTTARPWQAGDATRTPIIRLPHQVVYHDPGEVAGPIVEFRQTGPGALSGSLDLVQALYGQTVRIPLGQSPALGGGRYSSGGNIRVAAELRRIGNDAYVCGVWAESRGQSPRTEKQAPEVLARGSVLANGFSVIKDLRFMRKAPSRRSLARRQANCIPSGHSWDSIGDGARVTVRIPRQIVYQGPGETITFAPARPGG